MHQEVELAKAEIKQEVAAAGKGAGLFGGAGFAGVLALIFLSISAAYGISWLGIAARLRLLHRRRCSTWSPPRVLGLTGKKKISQVGPPEKTIETVKDDIAWAKHPTPRRRPRPPRTADLPEAAAGHAGHLR